MELLPVSPNYVIVDHICFELNQLQSNEQRPSYFKEMHTLFQLIDLHFDEHFRSVTSAAIQNADGDVLRTVDSTFKMCLTMLPWIPAARRVFSPAAPHAARDLPCTLPACDVYVRSGVVEELLAHRVPYLACSVNTSSSFAEFLQLKRNVSVSAVKNMLIEYSASSVQEGSSQPQEVVASRTHIKRVYKFLSDNLTPKHLQDLFEQNPVIFHSRATTAEARLQDLTLGVFLRRDQVWWRDPSALFHKYRKQVSMLNPEASELFRCELWAEYREHDMQEMFVRAARVQSSPDFKSYAKLLVEVSRSNTLTSATLEDVLKVGTW